MATLAVTGVTGGLGGRVARRLADRGVAQRVVARDPARAPELPGAEVVRAAYGDGEAMRRALDGVDTLLLVSASEATGSSTGRRATAAWRRWRATTSRTWPWPSCSGTATTGAPTT